MAGVDKGLLIVISGPSGVGKGTLCRVLAEADPNLVQTTSLTTRLPRQGEKDGADYIFVDENRFNELIKQGAFLEWAKVHDNYYGTSAAEVEELQRGKYDVIIEIDVQGGAQIRARAADVISIFILPPSMEELWQRLVGRGTDSAEAMQRRFANARSELREVWNYDYIVVNDDVSRAVKEIEGIMLAEKNRVERNKKFLTDFLEKR